MKKSLGFLLSLSLLSGSLLILSAQSPPEELNQVELLNQFIGDWAAEIGEDTMIEVKIAPLGGALDFTREVKVSGTTVNVTTGIFGFSQDKRTVIAANVLADGSMYLDYGRFVSAVKFVSETYLDHTEHPLALEEIEIQSPDSFTVRSRWRGEEMSWDADWTPVWTFHRIE